MQGVKVTRGTRARTPRRAHTEHLWQRQLARNNDTFGNAPTLSAAMNHLVGALSDNPISKMLIEREAEPLKQFKEAYYSHVDANQSSEPLWEISPDALPESGWRALDDVTLLRFLRADMRKGKFDHAASMARLLDALAWRKKMRSDELLASPANEAYELLRIRRWVGFDKTGRPVQFERLGKFLASGNSKAFTPEQWLAHYARDLETHFVQLRQAAMARKEPISNYLFCADFEGGSGIVWHLGSVIPLLKMLTKQVEARFPEIVGNIVIFNAPRIFASLFPMVKAFMDPITAAKVEVHASVPIERLLALMGPEAIPVEYGGTNTAPYPQTRIHGAASEASDVSDAQREQPASTSDPQPAAVPVS